MQKTKTEIQSVQPVTPETPAMDMLEAFKRDVDKKSAPKIQYTQLDEHADTALAEENQRMKLFWEAEPGSVEEEQLARRAAIGYFVLTGAQLQRTGGSEQQKSSEHFTEASIELYGQPEKEEILNIAAAELVYFKSLVGKEGVDQERLDRVIGYYKQQVGNTNVEGQDDDLETQKAVETFKNVIESKYKDALAIFDEASEGQEAIQPEKGKSLVEKSLEVLAESNPAWKDWTAVLTQDASWSENRRDKTIGIGRKAKDPKFLKSTVAHEIFVHVQRSINGEKIDNKLRLGLPGFLDSEEGLAVFVANAVRGVDSDRAKDFYLDTATAIGLLGQPEIPRAEMQKIYKDRLIIRAQAAGKTSDETEIDDKAWGYVNRIYRGSLGNEVVGVNTKDISYYHGLIKITNYIKQKLSEGVDPEKLFDYMSAAPFDPTNPRHVEHMAKHGVAL